MKLQVIERTDGDTPPEHRPVVVFLHGLFGRARNLGFLQRATAGTFRTLAPDLRNHGDSPHGPVSYAAMAQDVLETLDALNIQKFSIVGHSMGGKVAMQLALTSPERVQRLFVADMAPAPTRHGQSAMIERFKSFTFPDHLERKEALTLLDPITGSRAVSELMCQNLKLGEKPGWAIGFDALAAEIAHIEGWEAPSTQPYLGPALFLRGENSPYVQEQHYPLIKALFPQALIQTLPDAGHWLHVDQPKAFLSVMTPFLLNE
ncbi:esterase [Neokomagataea thailandica NBRC 106555]|uniref:Esterase n=1 Tax=Neokomagataea thailandica NBRC 106555 TaxID=1223520 RepID=A0ABQ0QN67_9PROT|nr:alpha/beta fold hydrolase [Neokomagataea thailandica]GBR51193.1 esterase [Neokomagataea thailandica NBRC 106555]